MFKLKDLVKFMMPVLSFDTGGGGGGGGAANQTVKQENAVSAFAAPYVESMLGKTEALTEAPYQTYGGQRTADFTGMQNQAFGAAGNLGTAQQTTDASNMAAQAGIGALNTQYQGGQFGNTYQGLQAYDPGQYGQQNVQAQQLQNYQMGPAERVGAQTFGGQSAQDYMSPYMQNVVDIQQREAQRTADIAGTSRGANAARSGAFGGSRQAVMDAEAARNLATQKGDIQSQGLQSAYQQAQQQFNADQARQLQAQQANQGAGLTVGQQNLAANLGVQQLGSGQNLQAQQLNQANNLATQQAQQQANQFGYGQQAANAQNLAQYGQAANQLNAQQQQFGANLGLQGLQAANQAASTLGQLGQNQYAQTTGNINMQNQLGTQQQQQQQNILNQQYADFNAQKQDPYNKLAFQQSMLSGLPISSSTQSVYSNPSMLSQVAGLGTAAAGAYGLSKGIKKGGKIKEQKRPAGLAELAIHNMA
jgi:hypothetical protein